jgi:hypothetical protein
MNEESGFGEIVDEIKHSKQPEHPVRALLIVPHKGGRLIVARDAFGSNNYLNNIRIMRRPYFHPNSWERISFEPLTTDESLSAAVYEFSSRAKPHVFDPSCLQAGYVLRTGEGVWANPLDAQGMLVEDENVLKKRLKNCRKIGVRNGNHIYIGNGGFGFAEYGTFDLGKQSEEDFANGGLARVLENTSEPVATNLRAIADKSNYENGVRVMSFEPVKSSILRVVSLCSGGGDFYCQLCVSGDYGENSRAAECGGYAFGGLKTGEATR